MSGTRRVGQVAASKGQVRAEIRWRTGEAIWNRSRESIAMNCGGHSVSAPRGREVEGQWLGLKGNLLGVVEMRTWECRVAKRGGPKPISRVPEARDSTVNRLGATRAPGRSGECTEPFRGARVSCAPQRDLLKPQASNVCECDPIWKEGLCRCD